MKRRLIAIGLLCCLLTACAPEKEPPVTDETTVTTGLTSGQAPEDTLPPIYPPEFPDAPKGGIGEVTTVYDYKEGDTTILHASFTLPVASIEGDQALQDTLSGRLAAWESELKSRIDGLYQQYLRDYKAGREGLTTPSVQVRFDLHYFTSEAVSMTYILTETTWDGMVSSHSYHANLDLRVGSEIRLSALLKDGSVDALADLLTDKLVGNPPQGLYESAEQILVSRLEASWYIVKGSLTVYCEPGVIAPISSGSVEITFTETELESLLSEYGKALL